MNKPEAITVTQDVLDMYEDQDPKTSKLNLQVILTRYADFYLHMIEHGYCLDRQDFVNYVESKYGSVDRVIDDKNLNFYMSRLSNIVDYPRKLSDRNNFNFLFEFYFNYEKWRARVLVDKDCTITRQAMHNKQMKRIEKKMDTYAR